MKRYRAFFDYECGHDYELEDEHGLWVKFSEADAEITLLQKRITELETMIVRLHNTNPQNIKGILKWWEDMITLIPTKISDGGKG